ncbi:GAF domain-containing protein [Halobellus sp. GM3]|uniref:GAF domain-containing protein n=1 Tax=Halobellus sp. GM3 TaxID=3458410 RepID=UPI00403DF9DA
MTGESAGGRVLVVGSSSSVADDGGGDLESGRNDGTDEKDDPASEGPGTGPDRGFSGGFVRGNAPACEGGQGGDHPGSGGERSEGEIDVSSIVSRLEHQLDTDVVVRYGETASEYVAELGPTIDCVVILGGGRGLVRDVVKSDEVPIVVYDPPAIAVVEGTTVEEGAVDELNAHVRSVIRENKTKDKLRESNARLTALSHYAEDITACETVDAVIQRTVEATTDALAFEFCVVLLAEGDRLVSRGSTLPDSQLSPVHIEEGIAGRTHRTGESEIIDDIQADPDAIIEHDGFHALLSVPIDERGVIQVASDCRGAFDERDREFLETLAGYTREALERIEREVTLREERDRLHAFFDVLPAPAVCVERPDGVARVADVNGAYIDRFGDVEGGSALTEEIPTDDEIELYLRALQTGEASTATIERPAADGSAREFTLSLVPASPPGSLQCIYGIYHEWSG